MSISRFLQLQTEAAYSSSMPTPTTTHLGPSRRTSTQSSRSSISSISRGSFSSGMGMSSATFTPVHSTSSIVATPPTSSRRESHSDYILSPPTADRFTLSMPIRSASLSSPPSMTSNPSTSSISSISTPSRTSPTPSFATYHQPHVTTLQCSRCAVMVETLSSSNLRHVSTDDVDASGMIRFGTNLYYCRACAKRVGYGLESG